MDKAVYTLAENAGDSPFLVIHICHNCQTPTARDGRIAISSYTPRCADRVSYTDLVVIAEPPNEAENR